MPALPSKGKSRDLSFAALIPVSAGGVVKRLGSPSVWRAALTPVVIRGSFLARTIVIASTPMLCTSEEVFHLSVVGDQMVV